MEKNSFPANKYTLVVLMLLLCVMLDILMHMGMSRVMIPKTFTVKRDAQRFPMCNQPLVLSGKYWEKAINSVSKMQGIPLDAAGIEMDVYFDGHKNEFQVYHDSSSFSAVSASSLLGLYDSKHLTASIWFDFKNLSSANERQALQYLVHLRSKFHLQNKVIVESSSPQFLQSFCDSGFHTSYYTPYFNPYEMSEQEILLAIDSVSSVIRQYPTSAMSGYYFQYPLLKKYFPQYPILTWADKSAFSIISLLFHHKLGNDSQVKIVLISN
jgi:hypothetical protein